MCVLCISIGMYHGLEILLPPSNILLPKAMAPMASLAYIWFIITYAWYIAYIWFIITVPADALAHWGRDKMAAIFQTTLSNTFSSMKMYKFWLKFHWSLFLRVQLITSQHWFRQWLGASQATSHCLNQSWLVYWRIYAQRYGRGNGLLPGSTKPLTVPVLCHYHQDHQ